MSGVALPFHTIASALPEELPIFPLTGAVLLPHARLPLNIFEPRYLAMVEDALGKGRLIGMVQPQGGDDVSSPLYSVGCVGRIASFTETDDGRLMIVLAGVCRFRIQSELPMARVYRAVRPDWKPYLADLEPADETFADREHLLGLMRVYFKKAGIGVDWNLVQNAPDDVLLSTIIMICPLPPNEKQALLEAANFVERTRMLTALLEMAVSSQGENEADSRH